MTKSKKKHAKGSAGRVEMSVEAASDNFIVLWHPDAESEASSIDAGELAAIENGISKLRSAGTKLDKRHSDHVGDGLWELRLFRSRSPWRAIYKQVGKKEFVILAVCPEYEQNKKGFRKGCKDAAKRFEELEAD
jgi:Phage derived protein Gp49-like (DUF891).